MSFAPFARICAWGYLALTWLSYLGITLVADAHQYSVLQYLSFLFVLAVELVFPVLIALFLADVALAVLARVAPQFGIFTIGLQLKVALALGALVVTMPLLMPRLHQLFMGVTAVSLAVFK